MKPFPKQSRASMIESLEPRKMLSTVMPAIMYPGQTGPGTETASASIVATQLSGTDFQYSITVKDTATGQPTAANQIGTFWYAWVPGSDFLDTAPLTVSSPSGWTDQIVNAGPNDGFSIQWVASANAIQAGSTLGGFVFTLQQRYARTGLWAIELLSFGWSNVNTAFTYSGAPFSDAGFRVTPATSVTPAPTPVAAPPGRLQWRFHLDSSGAPAPDSEGARLTRWQRHPDSSGYTYTHAGVAPTPTPVAPSSTETASAGIVASQLTGTTFQYSISVKDTATGQPTAANQIGTFWYAWVPGADFLDTAPLSVSSPSGWTDQIVHARARPTGSDGYSVQWVALVKRHTGR